MRERRQLSSPLCVRHSAVCGASCVWEKSREDDSRCESSVSSVCVSVSACVSASRRGSHRERALRSSTEHSERHTLCVGGVCDVRALSFSLSDALTIALTVSLSVCAENVSVCGVACVWSRCVLVTSASTVHTGTDAHTDAPSLSLSLCCTARERD